MRFCASQLETVIADSTPNKVDDIVLLNAINDIVVTAHSMDIAFILDEIDAPGGTVPHLRFREEKDLELTLFLFISRRFSTILARKANY